MSHSEYTHHTLYVGMHDGVCVLTSADAGQTWRQGPPRRWPMPLPALR
jgi:hypothetical protein